MNIQPTKPTQKHIVGSTASIKKAQSGCVIPDWASCSKRMGKGYRAPLVYKSLENPARPSGTHPLQEVNAIHSHIA